MMKEKLQEITNLMAELKKDAPEEIQNFLIL